MNVATASHRGALDATLSEEQWQTTVLDYARLWGWRVAHFRPGRTATGWRTAVSGDGKGFPDLVLVRDGRLMFVELKTEKGVLSAEQRRWRARLEEVAALTPTVAYRLWRPRDWADVESALR